MNFKLYLSLVVIISFFLKITECNAESTANNKRVLTIYSSSSFAKDWTEEGHPIKENFEKLCNCHLDLVSIDSGGTLLSRVMLEGKRNKADLVLGLDSNLMADAETSGLFAEHNMDFTNLELPLKWKSKYFVPFDYGFFAFVYNEDNIKNPPKSFEELLNNDKLKIIIQDPRSSTVGMGLLSWVKYLYKEDSEKVWRNLFKKIVTVTKGWSEGYGLFLKGESDLFISYSTSPAYHMIAEKSNKYKSAIFKEGHYLQVEIVGKLKNSKNPDLADMFLNFVLTKDFQSQIPMNNFMYPIIDIGSDMPPEYNNIAKPEQVLYFDPYFLKSNKNQWIQEWLMSSAKD